LSVPVIPLVAEIGAFLIAGAVFYGLKMRFGWTVAFFFLLGSILWTTPLETLGILTGSYSYTAFAGSLFPSYKGYLIWIGVVPLWIEMGWFIISASSFIIFHEVLMRGKKAIAAAAVAGLFAVNLDLMIDPVASSNNLWVWLGPAINLFGIPLYNYVGWFIMIFFYDIIIWSTVVGFRRMKGLSIVEMKLFRIRQYVEQVSLKKRVGGFVFRMAILEVVAILLIKMASLAL
jgi:uncharacterized membrane protein